MSEILQKAIASNFSLNTVYYWFDWFYLKGAIVKPFPVAPPQFTSSMQTFININRTTLASQHMHLTTTYASTHWMAYL